jgi:hypothetical protein
MAYFDNFHSNGESGIDKNCTSRTDLIPYFPFKKIKLPQIHEKLTLAFPEGANTFVLRNNWIDELKIGRTVPIDENRTGNRVLVYSPCGTGQLALSQCVVQRRIF